jgi:hypothetical protein
MTLWVYDEKFPMDMQFLFGMLLFTAGENNDLGHSTQEQEERHTTTINFEFPRVPKNSATTFQVAIRALDSLPGLCPGTDLSADPIFGSTVTTSFDFSNQLRQIQSTVQHDHRMEFHRRLPGRPS